MNPVQLFAFVVGVVLFAIVYNIWQNKRIDDIEKESNSFEEVE